MNEKKILYTSCSLSPQSGAFAQLLRMEKGVRERGWETCLVLPPCDRFEREKLHLSSREESHHIPIPRARVGTLFYYLRFAMKTLRTAGHLAGIIKDERVDIVHANEFYDLYAGIAAKAAGVPCVWHVRGEFSDLPLIHFSVPRLIKLLAERIITVSRSVKQRVFVDQGLDGEKIAVIHDPGPDPGEFNSGVDSLQVRGEFGLDPESPVITLIAKISQRKGHETFIRAAASVLESFPKATFLVVGGVVEGTHHRDYAERLFALPRELSIQDQVVFTGYRVDIPQIMAASDIIVHCSTYPDPFPGVVLQAMAVGKPVIAANAGGVREQIEDGVSGILVNPGDPQALADDMITLLTDPDQRRALGEEASRRVGSTFSGETFFSRLMGLYADLEKDRSR